jgi:hypothetical protein
MWRMERINNLNLTAIMSTNSKFVRNRLNKLIGKVPKESQEFVEEAGQGKGKGKGRGRGKGGLFRDYTYIRLHSQSGKVSQLFSFACFRDDRIYDFAFPIGQQMLHDNDEDSNQLQIQEDVQRGVKALQKEIADCSSTNSHCDDTLESSELS